MPAIGNVHTVISPAQLLPGVKVLSGSSTPQAKIAGNSNHAWGYYSPAIIIKPFGVPLEQATTDMVDHLVLPTTETEDSRGLELLVWARNSDGSNAATLRAELDGDGAYDEATVPPSTTTSTLYTLTLTSVDIDRLMLRAGGSTGLKIDSISLRWATVASDSYEPKDSGFRFTDLTSELGADLLPLSDEEINRWTRNPRIVWRGRPAGIGTLLDGLQQVPQYKTSSVRGLVAPITTYIRYDCTLRWWALLVGPATGSALVITDDQQDEALTLGPAPQTALPASGGPYVMLSGAMSVSAGLHRFSIEVGSNAIDDTALYTLIGMVDT